MKTEKETPKGRPLLDDGTVEDIIKTPKFIPSDVADAADMGALEENGGHLRRNIELKCDGYDLRMSIRQLRLEPLDFSVLLIYTNEAGQTYNIRRYNGNHGIHKDRLTGEIVSGPHIHMITEEAQRSTHKDEGHAVATDRYRTLPDAINVFMTDLDIRYEKVADNRRLDEYDRCRQDNRGDEEGHVYRFLDGRGREEYISGPHRIHVPGW